MRKDFNTSAKQALPFWQQPRCRNPRLPAELLDHTVDLPRDERYALESCYLVSKSWVSRIRKHLFAEVEFLTPRDAQSLENCLSGSIHLPACYTKSLTMAKFPRVGIVGEDGVVGDLIRSFTRVVYLLGHQHQRSTYLPRPIPRILACP